MAVPTEHQTPHSLSLLFPPDRIAAAVDRIAGEINRDYSGKQVLLVGVLKGCFVFMADIVRLLKMPVEVDFITLSSYAAGKETSEKVRVVRHLRAPVAGKEVIIIEDIADTGVTLDYLLRHLRRRHPASIRVCALLDKISRRKIAVPVDYCGFTVPDKFVVGYGIDWSEQFRSLPGIYAIDETA